MFDSYVFHIFNKLQKTTRVLLSEWMIVILLEVTSIRYVRVQLEI